MNRANLKIPVEKAAILGHVITLVRHEWSILDLEKSHVLGEALVSQKITLRCFRKNAKNLSVIPFRLLRMRRNRPDQVHE